MESVTIEVRPRLCAINANIRLKKSENDHLQKCTLKIQENSISLEFPKKIVSLDFEFIKIVPTTLSSLKIKTDWISFRAQTNPTDPLSGSFGVGLIKTDDLGKSPFQGLEHQELPEEKTNYLFRCVNCKILLTKVVSFKRILPLPGHDFDMTGWFCCSKSNFNLDILKPGETDYFYNSHYFIMNKCNFVKDLKTLNSVFHCKRCFCELGEVHDEESWKFWNYSIEKVLENGDVAKKATPVFDDFLFVIKDLIGIFPGEELLLHAKEKNGIFYLLLKPMEFKVDMLVENENENDVKIGMKRMQVMKVLYCYGEDEKFVNKHCLNGKNCKVGSKVLSVGLEFLSKSTQRFPLENRYVDGFFMGFLPLSRSH